MKCIMRWPLRTMALRLPQAMVAEKNPAISPVGAVRIAVRYRNRIVGDEVGAVVFVVERVEQLLQIGVRHGVRSIRSKTSVCGMP